MRSIILHDAEVGDYCIIAAGSLVKEGMTIPDKSFVVGVPAEIKGEASSQQLWWVHEGLSIYNKLTKQYKQEGL